MTVLADRFELVRELGHGGLATVYQARDRLLDRDVAIKLIHEHLAGDPLIFERFRHELEINRLVRHPQVVEYYELHADGERKFLALEFMPGGDLKTRLLREGRLPVPAALDIAAQILDALGKAHGQGIIHADIKPHNILFTEDGRAKLSDFGLARLSSGEQHARGQVNAGTPEYSPPELVLAQVCDARSDLYALGVSLFEMLCGCLPFSANSALEILRAHVHKPVPDPLRLRPELDPRLGAVLQKALAKDPLERFQSAAQFRAALPTAHAPVSAASDALSPGHVTHHKPAPEDKPAPEAIQVQAGNSAAGLVCRSCGRRLSRLLPYCFACSLAAPRLEAAASGAKSACVYVTGPGAPGTKFDALDRGRLLKLLEQNGADTTVLNKKVPRLPFILAKGLTPVSARQLADAVSALGIEASSGSFKEEQVAGSAVKPGARSLFKAKETALTGRGFLILLGSSGGLYGQIGRLIDKPEIGLPLVLGGAALLAGGILTATLVGSRRPQAKPADTAIKGTEWQKAQAILQPLCGSLEAPALKGLAATVSLKLERLFDADRFGRLAAAELQTFFSELEAWVALCLAAQEIERYLSGRPESVLLEALRGPGAPDELRRELVARRELEQSYNRIFDQILAFNTGLDTLSLASAAGAQGMLFRSAAALRESLAQAGALLDSVRIGESNA